MISDFTNSWINTKFLIFKGFIEHHFCVESNVSKWCSLSNMAHKNEDNTLSTLPCNFIRFLVTKGSYKNENWKILLWYNPEECEFSRFKFVLKNRLSSPLSMDVDWKSKLGYTHSYYSLYQEDSHLTSLQHWYQLILIMSATVCTPATWRLRRWAWSVLYFSLVLTRTVYSGRTIS